jgi:hypothetical protein
MKKKMSEAERLKLITETVLYCKRVREMGMPASCWAKALREPIFFLWELKDGSKEKTARYRSKKAADLSYGQGKLVRDHAVPFKYLRDALLSLDDVTATTVRATLERFPPTAVLITKEEMPGLHAQDMVTECRKTGIPMMFLRGIKRPALR